MNEISESQATGALAEIYADIRTYCAVPYVSSLQRHVATMPGCLEYAWAALRPAFLDGTVPETAWRRATTISMDPFPPLSAAALRLLGVDDEGAAAIRNICENFVRVAPINLLFAGCIERLIDGAEPKGNTAPRPRWSPPEMLAPMPAMIDMAGAPPDIRAVLFRLRGEIGGQPFVPGLYRMLARWPAYLAHAAALIEPKLNNDAARTARAAIAMQIVEAAEDIVAGLPPIPDQHKPPTDQQSQAILGAIRTYRVTSPEMIVFGTLLRDALPETVN